MSTLSKQLTNILTKEEHKSDGIYFTPPDDVEYIVKKDHLNYSFVSIKTSKLYYSS